MWERGQGLLELVRALTTEIGHDGGAIGPDPSLLAVSNCIQAWPRTQLLPGWRLFLLHPRGGCEVTVAVFLGRPALMMEDRQTDSSSNNECTPAARPGHARAELGLPDTWGSATCLPTNLPLGAWIVPRGRADIWRTLDS